MTLKLGNIWWEKLISEKQHKDILLLDDAFIKSNKFNFSLPPLFKDIVTNRADLRKWCTKNGYIQPAWTIVKRIEDATSWINKINKFPVCIKPVINSSNGSLIYKIESYKNLLEYFEKLTTENKNSEVLLEEWIESSITLEVTIWKAKIIYASKQQLAKSLEIKFDSRIMPVNLPEFVKHFVEELIARLNLEQLDQNFIVRFTFAISNNKCILISINMAYNRIEYLSGFSEYANYTPLLECTVNNNNNNKNRVNTQNFTQTLVQLKFYHVQNKDIYFPKLDLQELIKYNVLNYFSINNNAVALIVGNNLNDLRRNTIIFTRYLEEEMTKRY